VTILWPDATRPSTLSGAIAVDVAEPPIAAQAADGAEPARKRSHA